MTLNMQIPMEVEAPMSTLRRELHLSVFARTNRGARTVNQDAFLIGDLTSGRVGLGDDVVRHSVGPRGTLLAVSDGTGDAGEVASELLLTSLHRLLGVISLDLDAGARLRHAATHAAEYVHMRLRREGRTCATGATLTAVLVHDGIAHVAQIGDSRAYLVRDGSAVQISKDQTLSQALVDAGTIGLETLAPKPPHMILQLAGRDASIAVSVTVVDVRAGDALLVCSDGLSNAMASDEMQNIVCQSLVPSDACRALVETAVSRGGENVTAVLCRVEATGGDISSDEAITWTFPDPITP